MSFLSKVKNRVLELREELDSRPETLPTDMGGYSNPSLLGEDDGFDRVGFMGGGKMHYNEGGSLLADDMPTHTMPDGTVHPGATHENYMAMMSGANSLYMANKGMRMKKRYTQGGRF